MGRPLPRIESDTDAGRHAGRQAGRQAGRHAGRRGLLPKLDDRYQNQMTVTRARRLLLEPDDDRLNDQLVNTMNDLIELN